MGINPEIFRGYDIRGVIGKDIEAQDFALIGKAHGSYLKSIDVNKCVVGADNRLSSEDCCQAIIDGLISTGINVIDLGMVITSITYWAQYYYKAKGCVMVTASHNPAEYNGVKLGNDYSSTHTPMDKIKEMVLDKKFTLGEGKLEKAEPNFIEVYYQDLLSKVGQIKPFKVVIDASNGAAGKFLPELLRKVGCEVIEQNCELDGSFPNGTPDPTEEKVAERLSEGVKKEGADIGFSYDGDGDRMGLVDEKGDIIWNDVLVAIFADDVISKNPGAEIVYNALCSRVVPEVIEQAGGKPVMWMTGHAYIKAKVQELKSPFGGELSGHFFFMDNFYGHDDAAYASLRILDYLTRKGKALSEIVEKFPQFISSPETKLGCPDDKKNEVVKSIGQKFITDFPNAKLTQIDGVRLDFPDGMMIVRVSQNGPYLTVKFEAKDQKTYDERRQYIGSILKSYPEINWTEGVNIELFG